MFDPFDHYYYENINDDLINSGSLEDMKEKILTNEERISENSNTIHDMNSTNSDVKSLVPGAEVVDPSSGDNHLPQEEDSLQS